MWLQGLTHWVGERVDRAWRLGQPDRALLLARRYVRFRPRDVGALRLLCRALAKAGRYEDLEATARRGLAKHDHDDELAYSLGLALEGQTLEGKDRGGEARTVYLGLIERSPRSPFPHVGLAAMASHRKEWSEAGRLAREAEELGVRDNPYLLVTLVGSLLPGPTTFERARKLLLEAGQQLPQDGPTQLLVSVALEQHDRAAAEQAFARARELYRMRPDDVDADRAFLRKEFARYAAAIGREGNER